MELVFGRYFCIFIHPEKFMRYFFIFLILAGWPVQPVFSQSYQSLSDRSGLDLVFLAGSENGPVKRSAVLLKKTLVQISQAETAARTYPNGKRLLNKAVLDRNGNAVIPADDSPGFVTYSVPDSSTVRYLFYRNIADSLPSLTLVFRRNSLKTEITRDSAGESITLVWLFQDSRTGSLTEIENGEPVSRLEWTSGGKVTHSRKQKNGKWKTVITGTEEG